MSNPLGRPDAWNTGLIWGAQSEPAPDPAERWSIGADLLPIHRRLAMLGDAVRTLMQRYARSESEWREWARLISATNEYPGRIPEPEVLGLADIPVGRLYPANPEKFPGRAYIEDSPMIPRIQMRDNADYGAALVRFWEEIGRRGFLLLEWDLAIDASDYLQMCAYVFSDPEAVWAAPYFLYYPGDSLVLPSQVPDYASADDKGNIPFVPFGCTYLPSWVLERMAGGDGARRIIYPSPDHNFNIWANEQTPPVRRRLAYYCRPKHLHYGEHVSMVPGGPDIRPPK